MLFAGPPRRLTHSVPPKPCPVYKQKMNEDLDDYWNKAPAKKDGAEAAPAEAAPAEEAVAEEAAAE